MSNTTISIIGGGCSGTMIAAQQMLNLIEQKTMEDWASTPEHKINFRLYDKDGSTGRGEPYGLDRDGVFLLNQPAYAMSPFPKYPDHFSIWLQNNNYYYNQDDFVPRSIYGEYLQEVFQKAVQTYTRLGFGSVDIVISNVANVCPANDGKYIVVSDNYQADPADMVILASGHSRSDLLSEHSHNPHYFSAPYDKEKAKSVLKETADPVMIVGTSQSMLDSLALLDHIKFPNPIYAVSRRLVKPWLFDAKAHRENRHDVDDSDLEKVAIKTINYYHEMIRQIASGRKPDRLFAQNCLFILEECVKEIWLSPEMQLKVKPYNKLFDNYLHHSFNPVLGHTSKSKEKLNHKKRNNCYCHFV
ncbi:MAG: FAD/NAD(P)-binding protein [Alphaproteobacteria bacterium]